MKYIEPTSHKRNMIYIGLYDIYWTDESQEKHDIYWTDELQEKHDIYMDRRVTRET